MTLFIVGPVFGQVEFAVEQALKAGGGITQMNAYNAVVDFAATAEPLSAGANGVIAAFGGARFVDATNRVGVGMFASDQLLAAVADSVFIPLDRFEKPL